MMVFDVKKVVENSIGPIESFKNSASRAESVFTRSINSVFVITSSTRIDSFTNSGSSTIQGIKNSFEVFVFEVEFSVRMTKIFFPKEFVDFFKSMLFLVGMFGIGTLRYIPKEGEGVILSRLFEELP